MGRQAVWQTNAKIIVGSWLKASMPKVVQLTGAAAGMICSTRGVWQRAVALPQ